MSTPPRPDLARGWRHAESVLDAEANRLAELSDAEFEREMDAEPPLADALSADEVLLRADAQASATEEDDEPRTRWWSRRALWLAAAALVAVLLMVFLPRTQGTAGVSVERAVELRRTAIAECEAKVWAACLKDLAIAKELDPEGDNAAPVQDARARAVQALRR